MAQVTLVKSGKSFEVAPDETIMDAAYRAGIYLEHNCLNGICRACMTRVLSGTVEHNPAIAAYLNIERSEVANGYRLLCSAFARTDVELDK